MLSVYPNISEQMTLNMSFQKFMFLQLKTVHFYPVITDYHRLDHAELPLSANMNILGAQKLPYF